MAGDLLHLIREAERNAKNKINEAERKARQIIQEAESKAKDMLSQVESFGNVDNEKIDAKVQKQINQLQNQLEKQKIAAEKSAKNKHESGVRYVVKSLLELD
ncbi:MAG: hypothetical protein ACTSR2_10335 [Candidatus Hodarchaeales archaeon]